MKQLLFLCSLPLVITSCNGQTAGNNGNTTKAKQPAQSNFIAGKDYQEYQRVRLLDKQGFTEPQEAYSVLLPKGWTSNGEVIWNQPGTACAGTFKRMSASSADGKYTFTIFPDLNFNWNPDPAMRQFQQSANGSFCSSREPIQAEPYLKQWLANELGSPQLISVEPNLYVVQEMSKNNGKAEQELRSYGAGQMQFQGSAVNAKVKWKDGTEGLITVGVNILALQVPNVYNGTSNTIYTTMVSHRSIFKYPEGAGSQAENLLSVILPSFRSNPAWNDAVNGFWKQVRQQSHVVHVGRIKMMDEQTRRIGEQAIRNGQDRQNAMDQQMRNWEQRQSSQDRMHTAFIKTIREVENYRDETGKYEMSSFYNHAWSRSDGSSFIMSNNPNFNPASVLQDQQWKEMKRVE